MADGTDEAGPLLGWSLGSGLKRRTIDELQQFPCVFCFKAVGVAARGFVGDLRARVAEVLGRQVKDEEVSVRASENGRYESVTLELYVEDGDEVYSIYQALSEDSRIRFLL
jgi:putative lipoic acid-binding regulatory protein